MKEMMGKSSMPGLQGSSSRNKVEELDTDFEEDDTEQIQQLSRQMEAELKGTGVLDLDRPSQKAARKQALSGQKSEESQEKEGKKEGKKEDEPGIDEDDDPDINLAENLLESLQGQGGTAGPAGNMLSMMNLPIPKGDRNE